MGKDPGKHIQGLSNNPEIRFVVETHTIKHSPNAMPAKKRTTPSPKRLWSEQEDQALVTAVQTFGPQKWKNIAAQVPGRNHIQCIQRWKKALDPQLRKGSWTKEEDDALQQMKLRDPSMSWSQLATYVQGRCGKQCRERWNTILDPGIKHTPWTPQEDAVLLDQWEQFGNQWSIVARYLPGRSQTKVRDRWKALQRAVKRDGGNNNAKLEKKVLVGRSTSNGKANAPSAKTRTRTPPPPTVTRAKRANVANSNCTITGGRVHDGQTLSTWQLADNPAGPLVKPEPTDNPPSTINGLSNSSTFKIPPHLLQQIQHKQTQHQQLQHQQYQHQQIQGQITQHHYHLQQQLLQHQHQNQHQHQQHQNQHQHQCRRSRNISGDGAEIRPGVGGAEPVEIDVPEGRSQPLQLSRIASWCVASV
jgi:hypothetical protein